MAHLRARSPCSTVRFSGPPPRVVVSLDEVRNAVADLPLDLVLGVLSRISALAVKHGDKFSDAPRQGEFLNAAIVDDFPTHLPKASEMYAPGRVPYTGNRYLFIHEHVLCSLAKLALRHARTDVSVPSIRTRDYCRICRLLLILCALVRVRRAADDLG